MSSHTARYIRERRWGSPRGTGACVALSGLLVALAAASLLGCEAEEPSASEDATSPADTTTDGSSPVQDGAGEGGTVLELEPTWRVLDLGEDTRWSRVHAFGVGVGGQYALVGSNAVVALFDGEQARFLNLGLAIDLRAVWAASESSLVVAGTGGIVRHWDPSSQGWQAPNGLPPQGDTVYTALHGGGPDDIYLGSADGGLWRYVDGQWIGVIDQGGQSPTAGSPVHDIWVSADGVAFIAAGSRLTWGQGSGWQHHEPGRSPRAVWGFSSVDVVAVTAAAGGSGDFIHHFGPGGWASEKANAAAALQGLNDVWGTSPANLFAVGFKGTLIRYTQREGQGLAWGPTLSSERELYSVYSPPGTPADERLDPLALTLRSVAGLGAENMLMAVEGLQDTEGMSPTANLLHFKRHPVRPAPTGPPADAPLPIQE